jgi:hypothetical protein
MRAPGAAAGAAVVEQTLAFFEDTGWCAAASVRVLSRAAPSEAQRGVRVLS